MSAPCTRLMWAVTRDGEIYVTCKIRKVARHTAEFFRRGMRRNRLKIKWSVCRVRVTPLKIKERRR